MGGDTKSTAIRQGVMAYAVDSLEVEDVDVAAVLAWAEATTARDRTYTGYVLVRCDGAAGLVRLAGTDPTMTCLVQVGPTRHRH